MLIIKNKFNITERQTVLKLITFVTRYGNWCNHKALFLIKAITISTEANDVWKLSLLCVIGTVNGPLKLALKITTLSNQCECLIFVTFCIGYRRIFPSFLFLLQEEHFQISAELSIIINLLNWGHARTAGAFTFKLNVTALFTIRINFDK